MPLPTAYGTIPLGGALPEAYVPGEAIPLLGGALESGYGEVSYAVNLTEASSGSNGITVADDDDIDFGTGDFFLHWEGSLPDWTPGASQRVLRKYDAAAAGFVLNVNTNGTLAFSLFAGAGLLSYDSTAATGLQDGSIAKVTVSVVRSSASTAGSVTFYLNGTQLGSPVSIAAAASITASTATAMAICGDDGTTGTQRTASNTISCIVGNFAPTAAEVLDLCTNGIPASWKWGSQTAAYTSNFSAGVDSWVASQGAAAGNIDGIGGQDDWLRYTTNSTSSTAHYAGRGVFVAGKRYRVTLTYYIPSGQTAINEIGFYDGNISVLATKGTVTNSATTVTFTCVPTDANLRVYAMNNNSRLVNDPGGDDVFYIKGVTVTVLGATMALLPDTIPTSSATTWSDTSGNTGGGTLPAAGATKVTIRR